MHDFHYIPCPNCKIKIKIDNSKKYNDCPECKFEFQTETVAAQLNQKETSVNEKKESIFTKFLKENNL